MREHIRHPLSRSALRHPSVAIMSWCNQTKLITDTTLMATIHFVSHCQLFQKRDMSFISLLPVGTLPTACKANRPRNRRTTLWAASRARHATPEQANLLLQTTPPIAVTRTGEAGGGLPQSAVKYTQTGAASLANRNAELSRSTQNLVQTEQPVVVVCGKRFDPGR
jgi:hypothetical protein